DAGSGIARYSGRGRRTVRRACPESRATDDQPGKVEAPEVHGTWGLRYRPTHPRSAGTIGGSLPGNHGSETVPWLRVGGILRGSSRAAECAPSFPPRPSDGRCTFISAS